MIFKDQLKHIMVLIFILEYMDLVSCVKIWNWD